jgi:hypothetical protein
MKHRILSSCVAALCLAAGLARAGEIIDSKDNFAFTVPAGWEDQKGKFGLYVYAEGIGSLIGRKLSFSAESVEQGAERNAQLFERANTSFRRVGPTTSLKGKNWTAQVVTFQGTVNTILEMVAYDGRAYRTFALTVRNEEFARHKEKYWSILRSWRSPAT